jgi:hypothetical protein
VRIENLNRELAILGDMRPGTLFVRSNDCGEKSSWSKTSPPKKHGPCCEISFIGKAKGISKFVRGEVLPAFCEQR